MQQQFGPQCRLILISAPNANTYYKHIGFTNNTRCWVIEHDAIPLKTYDDPAVDLWMAKTEDNQPLGCGSFVSDVDGERVGIYAMATPPNGQRRGGGRAVIENAMKYYQAKGVKRFTLAATEVGFPLYQKLGFEVVAEPYVFILGSSTQFP